ncbi:MAG: terminase large subunit [Terrimicrobiaceae bacterium]
MDDLEHGSERGLRFDEAGAGFAIGFFKFLKHSKGEWAGLTIELEPWQMFIIAMLFGWKRADGTRRFRTSYTEVARKAGKSTIGAGIGLYLFMADGEGGAEVYTAATKRDQARITHAEATRMIKASPSLRKRVQVFKDNLNIPDTACKFEPLGADSDTMDGLNVHAAIIDEVHAHKTRDVWDKLETGTGARRQPMLFAITTAGFNRQSLCWQLHEYSQKILDNVLQDDSFFGIVYTLDEGDDWEDERTWIKANPNLGVSKKIADMREKATKAKAMPAALNAFLRLELNVWTQSETKWVSIEHWNACSKAVDATGLRGRTCYGGLDLSSNIDVTAFVLVFPPQAKDDDYQVLCRFFIPEESMTERSKRDRVPYDAWVRQGYITATPGNVIDYGFVMDQIDQDAQAYDLDEVAFDRWGATKIVQEIEAKGLTCVQFGQGFASMSAPMNELERLILGHKLAHSNNPVLTWMANNLVTDEDAAGNIKPSKEHSIERIDGMVALVMALDRATRNEGDKGSVYETRGLRTI